MCSVIFPQQSTSQLFFDDIVFYLYDTKELERTSKFCVMVSKSLYAKIRSETLIYQSILYRSTVIVFFFTKNSVCRVERLDRSLLSQITYFSGIP